MFSGCLEIKIHLILLFCFILKFPLNIENTNGSLNTFNLNYLMKWKGKHLFIVIFAMERSQVK
jgi:hypothetical protein